MNLTSAQMNHELNLLLAVFFALSTIGASSQPIKLHRLTLVNKSGLPIEVRLTGENVENYYYLRIPTGDREHPVEQVFTIVPDTYKMQPYYIELWDPVYGYSCEGAGSKTLYAYRNLKITFLECDITPRHRGESPIYKWPALRYIY